MNEYGDFGSKSSALKYNVLSFHIIVWFQLFYKYNTIWFGDNIVTEFECDAYALDAGRQRFIWLYEKFLEKLATGNCVPRRSLEFVSFIFIL